VTPATLKLRLRLRLKGMDVWGDGVYRSLRIREWRGDKHRRKEMESWSDVKRKREGG
jgi:hypothetical protein